MRFGRQATAAMLAATMLAAAPAAALPQAFVVVTEAGPVVRVITPDAACPVLTLDRRPLATSRRVAATAMASPSRPAAFPINVCEAALPAAARRLSFAGQRLPLLRRSPRRIVVIGDTGCRLKAAPGAGAAAGSFQACNDPAAFGFARVAARAARWRPDLVIHLGDYHYRESPCPLGDSGCAGSPHGYGWAAWEADFFVPGAPLLAAAPLVAVRGNHESCARAGQGWWRLLAGPAGPRQACDDPADDSAGDTALPFAVPLGRGAQLVVLDTSALGNAALAPDDARVEPFRASARRLAGLAQSAQSTILLGHHPLLGFVGVGGDGGAALVPAGAALQSAFAGFGPRLTPPRVDLLLSAHVHLWQQLDFASDHPSQLIVGFSGTAREATAVMPAAALAASPAPGAAVARFSGWNAGFGFVTMERKGPRRWRVTVRAADGAAIIGCRIEGRRSRCRPH